MKKYSDVLYPRYPYHGILQANFLKFNEHLQDFSQKVSYICTLETNGKLSSETAYEKINTLWQQLKQSKKQLGIGQPEQEENNKS